MEVIDSNINDDNTNSNTKISNKNKLDMGRMYNRPFE